MDEVRAIISGEGTPNLKRKKSNPDSLAFGGDSSAKNFLNEFWPSSNFGMGNCRLTDELPEGVALHDVASCLALGIEHSPIRGLFLTDCQVKFASTLMG